MNQKGLAPIVMILLIVAAVGGYFIYTNHSNDRIRIIQNPNLTSKLSPNPTTNKDFNEIQKKFKIQGTANLEQTTSWKTYKDDKYGLEVKYPPDWTPTNTSRVFESGDLISLYDKSRLDKNGSSFASFTIAAPVRTDKDINSWIKDHYSDAINNPYTKNPSLEISEQIINSLHFQRVFICAEGCFNYYYLKLGNFLYGFALNNTGPDEVLSENEQKLINILYTVNITP